MQEALRLWEFARLRAAGGGGDQKHAQTSLSFLSIKKKKKKLLKPKPTTGLVNPFLSKLNEDMKAPPSDQRGCVSSGPAGNAERCIDGGPSATLIFFPSWSSLGSGHTPP